MNDVDINKIKSQAEELIKNDQIPDLPIHQENGKIQFYTEFDALNDSNDMITVNGMDDVTIPIHFIPKIFDDTSKIPITTSLMYNAIDIKDSRNPYARLLERIFRETNVITTSIVKVGTGFGFSIPKDKSNIGGVMLECISVTPIWVMMIDLRPDSKTNWDFTIVRMTSVEQSMLWIPRGFGYCLFASKYLAVKNDIPDIDQKYKLEYFPQDVSIIRKYSVKPLTNEVTYIDTNPIVNNMAGLYMEDFKIKQEQDVELSKKEMQLLALFKTCSDGIKFDSDTKDDRVNMKEFWDLLKSKFDKDGTLWYK